MKFNQILDEKLIKTKKEKEILAIQKKYEKTLKSLKKLNDPYYYTLKQKMDNEISKLNPEDWNSNEIDQWLDLDDRKLKSAIYSNGMISPMDPLEIRAKKIRKTLESFTKDDSFNKIKKDIIDQYGTDAWKLAEKTYDLPVDQDEWETYISEE